MKHAVSLEDATTLMLVLLAVVKRSLTWLTEGAWLATSGHNLAALESMMYAITLFPVADLHVASECAERGPAPP